MECLRKRRLNGPFYNGSSAIMAIVTALAFCCCACAPSGNKTIVSIQGDQWLINDEPILAGSPAEGVLVNVRMVNAVFDDKGPAAADHLPDNFDPDENTARFMSMIPDYYTHGIRAFTISLQGGMPGYEGAVNTAFNADGSLKPDYLDRVAKVIRACDQQGVIVILSCFYQRQHSNEFALDGKQAILTAVTNVVQWVSKEEFSNVVLEVSNEFSHGGFNKWKDGEWLRSGDGQLQLIRHAKQIAPGLLVSTSAMGNGLVPEEIAAASDFIILHFNRTPLDLIADRITQARRYNKPVICNEDDKTGKVGAEAARLSVAAGAGWGFMHIKKNQSVPFEFDGARDDTVVYRMLRTLTTPGTTISDIAEEPLSVLITHPIDGDVFPAGEDVTLRAEIAGIGNDDEINIQFLAGDKIIGTLSAPPWELVWKNPPTGKYNVMAIVRDSGGIQILRSGLADFEVRTDSGK